MSRRPCAAALALVGALLAAATPTLAGGGFSDPIGIIAGDAGQVVSVVDATALGDTVSVAAVTDAGGDRTVRFSFSETDGETWQDTTEYEDSQAPRNDLCDDGFSDWFAGWTVQDTGERVLWLRTAFVIKSVSLPGASLTRPDVACVPGKRVAAVYLVTDGGVTSAWLRAYPQRFDFPDVELDLGRANKGSTPAIAATADHIHVAWMNGTRLRYKRFTVGDGPDHPLVARPTVTIEDATIQGMPRLAAHGGRVVLAWERKGDVVARVSADKGLTFKPRKRLFTGDLPSAKVAFLTDADVLGSTIVVSGAVVSEGISVNSSVRRTENNGGTWTKVAGSGRTQGFVVATLGGTPAATRLHLVWDERFSGADVQQIEAQYRDLD